MRVSWRERGREAPHVGLVYTDDPDKGGARLLACRVPQLELRPPAASDATSAWCLATCVSTAVDEGSLVVGEITELTRYATTSRKNGERAAARLRR